MRISKSTKIKIIILVLLILTILFSIYIINNIQILNNLFGIKIKQENEQTLPLFSYVVYDNQDKSKIKVLIKINNEQGIEYIEYPNGDILDTNGKTTIAIDYLATENQNHTFGIKLVNQEKINENLFIDNNTIQETVLGINIVTNMLGYKAAKIEKKITMDNYNDIYYKFGTSENWIKSEELAVTDYDLIQNMLLDTEGTTTTITAKIVNTITGDTVFVNSEKLDIDTTQVSESINADSLIKAIEANNIKTGKYEVTVADEKYNLKIYNIDNNIDMSINTSIGVEADVGTANGYAQNMIVLKVNGDLSIQEGTKLTSYTSKDGYGGPKGMLIYCTGTIINNGEISMTARGAKAEGQNVYLWKNATGNYEYVPPTGATGGNSVSANNTGITGNNGTNRSTGGGRIWRK